MTMGYGYVVCRLSQPVCDLCYIMMRERVRLGAMGYVDRKKTYIKREREREGGR